MEYVSTGAYCLGPAQDGIVFSSKTNACCLEVLWLLNRLEQWTGYVQANSQPSSSNACSLKQNYCIAF